LAREYGFAEPESWHSGQLNPATAANACFDSVGLLSDE